MGQKLRVSSGTSAIVLDLENGDFEVQDGTITLAEWQSLTKRLNGVLIKHKLIPAPEQGSRTHGGPVKKAPWFLRPWFDKVQPKSRRYD